MAMNTLELTKEKKPSLSTSSSFSHLYPMKNSVNTFETLCDLMNTDTYNEEFVQKMEGLFNQCCDGLENDSEKLLTTIYLKAVNRRIQSEVINQNIYDHINGVSQIELFDILIDQFPFVKHSQEIVNSGIVNGMKDQEVVTIIDIGVGLGSQMMNVISKAKELKQLKKLIVVGLGPFTDALSIAERNITGMKQELHFHLDFIPVPAFAEKFDFTSLTCLEGPVIINASLALHHIQTMEMRSKTLANLKSLEPLGIMLIEPNVNHFEPDFFIRFLNSYHHFSCLFRVIDQLNIREDQKNGLKLFFGREIEDIMGKPEHDRFEKHSTATEWIQLLKDNQWSISHTLLKENYIAEPGVHIAFHEEEFIGFTYQNETALAIIQAC